MKKFIVNKTHLATHFLIWKTVGLGHQFALLILPARERNEAQDFQEK